jgi:hypothetical protein
VPDLLVIKHVFLATVVQSFVTRHVRVCLIFACGCVLLQQQGHGNCSATSASISSMKEIEQLRQDINVLRDENSCLKMELASVRMKSPEGLSPFLSAYIVRIVRQSWITSLSSVLQCTVRYSCFCSEHQLQRFLSCQKSTSIQNPDFRQICFNDFQGLLLHNFNLYVVIYSI